MKDGESQPQEATAGEDPTDPNGTNEPNQWGDERAKRDYAARGNARSGNPEGVPEEDQ